MIFGCFYLILGLAILIVLIFLGIRDVIRGVRSVTGTVTGVDPKTHDTHIRYKIKNRTYEVSCPRRSSGFIVGLPDEGLKIVLKVRKDDPYDVLLIYPTLHTKLTSFSKDALYSNNYVWKVPVLFLSLSAFLIAIGVGYITGILQ